MVVLALYFIAIRRVLATAGQPLQAARARRFALFEAAASEKAALAAAAATDAVASGVDGGGIVGAAAEAFEREALEPMPFAYLPSVGALLLLVAAVASHTLLVLGKKWSVRFRSW